MFADSTKQNGFVSMKAIVCYLIRPKIKYQDCPTERHLPFTSSVHIFRKLGAKSVDLGRYRRAHVCTDYSYYSTVLLGLK